MQIPRDTYAVFFFANQRASALKLRRDAVACEVKEGPMRFGGWNFPLKVWRGAVATSPMPAAGFDHS